MVVPSPNPAGIEYVLYGVSCTGGTQCIAVGAWENKSDVYGTLIEEWNGAEWSLMTSPDEGGGDNFLTGVSCSSPSSCVAVGYSHDANPSSTRTLTEIWDGTSWSVATSPDVGSGDNALSAVSCSDATDCVAVGSSYSSSDVYRTLIESWDGTSWSVTTSPDVGSADNSLSGVSCSDTTDCVAVGWDESSGKDQTLTEVWDGTGWTVVASPDPGSSFNTLSAVSCASSTSCMAVGTQNDTQSLMESWDGTGWTVLSSPDPGTRTNLLFGVACAAVGQCQAVGTYTGPNNNIGKTLIVTSDGTSATQVSSPDQGSETNLLEADSCFDASSCVAVGFDFVGGFPGNQTEAALIEMAGGSSPDTTQVSASPSPALVGHTTTYQASVTPTDGTGTPTGNVTFTIGSKTLCSATLESGTASCASSSAPAGYDTIAATYYGDPTFAGSSGTTTLMVEHVAPSVSCTDVIGNASTTITLTSCTPMSTTNRSAGAPGSITQSGGTFTWKTSGGTTVAFWNTSSPGTGTCGTYMTEYELSGVVTGGTSSYTKKGDPISIDLCRGQEGSLRLAPSTTAGL